jgi:hypothetical protein
MLTCAERRLFTAFCVTLSALKHLCADGSPTFAFVLQIIPTYEFSFVPYFSPSIMRAPVREDQLDRTCGKQGKEDICMQRFGMKT